MYPFLRRLVFIFHACLLKIWSYKLPVLAVAVTPLQHKTPRAPRHAESRNTQLPWMHRRYHFAYCSRTKNCQVNRITNTNVQWWEKWKARAHEQAGQVTKHCDSIQNLSPNLWKLTAHVTRRFVICVSIAKHGPQDVYILAAGGTSCVRRYKFRLAVINVDNSLMARTTTCHFSHCVVKSIPWTK